MKKIVIAVLLFLGCLVPLVSAEVLFNDDDRLTLDILAANSDVKNGTLREILSPAAGNWA